MILFQIFGAIVQLCIGSFLALLLFPLWILFAVITSPVRIFSYRAHDYLVGKFFGMALVIVFMGKRGY